MSEVIASAPSGLGSVPRLRLIRSRAGESPWLPVALGVVLAFLGSLTWFQWWHPYIEHDDWDMLLPNGPTFVENHTARLLYEGRWLNDWWWKLGSQALSPRGAAILFAIAWLIVVAVIVRSLGLRWWSVPAVAALYSAPMMSMLSFWPATLAAPMWMLALTAGLLWLTRDRQALHLTTLVVGVVAISLGYPPLALLLLPFLVALHHTRSWRGLAVLAAAFVAAYIGGILLVFSLNDLRFGVFGLKIQAWRNPSPLNGLTSLRHHLHTVGRNWGAVLRPSTLPLLASLAALIVGLGEAGLRRRIGILTLALVGAAGLSASSTILNGVNVPARANVWFWPFLVLVCVWGLSALKLRRRAVAAIALVFVAAWSTLYSAYATLGHRADQRALDALRSTILAHHLHHPDARVIFAVMQLRPTAAERQAVEQVSNALAKFDGITATQVCVHCHLIHTRIDARDPRTWVFDRPGWIVVQLPRTMAPSGLYARGVPHWLVPLR